MSPSAPPWAPPSARLDFPAEAFPVVFEAMHPETGEVVWSATVHKPENLALLQIPPLKWMLGHPVSVRIRFADGVTLGRGESFL